MKGKVVSLNISPAKGTRKTPVETAVLKANFGMEGTEIALTFTGLI